MSIKKQWIIALGLMGALAGCGSGSGGNDAATETDAATKTDAAPHTDAGTDSSMADGAVADGAVADGADASPDATIPDPAIIRFSFESAGNSELRHPVEGEIAGALIRVAVPYWIDVTALVPTFVTAGDSVVKVGATVQESGVTPNDFTDDVTYVVTAGGESASYVVSVSRAPFEPSQVQVIQASDKEADDAFSFVRIHGNTAVVAAPNADSPDGSVMNAGAAYAFERGTDGVWSESKIFDSNLTGTDGYGASFAAGDNVVIVGANYESSGQGAVYIYQKGAGGAWPLQKLTPVDPIDYENFGNGVAIVGDYLFVGAPFAGPADYSNNPGTVYVYKNDGTGNWVPDQALTASDGVGDGDTYDSFGDTLAVSGDHLIIGADFKTIDGAVEAGSAYIFELNHTTGMWEEKAKLHASDAQVYDRFGARVAISGDHAVVEAPNEGGGDGDPDKNSGSLYIFERGSDGAWTQAQILHRKDLDPKATQPDAFDIDKDVLVIGDKNYSPGDPPLYSSGRVFVFQRNTAGIWQRGTELVLSPPGVDFNFGMSVSIDRGTVMVGAIGAGDNTPEAAGAVYIFE